MDGSQLSLCHKDWGDWAHLRGRHQYLHSQPDVFIARSKSLFPEFLEYQVLSFPLSLRSPQDGDSSLARQVLSCRQPARCRRSRALSLPSTSCCCLLAFSLLALFALLG